MKNIHIRNQKGFTLIELLVVIAIIGILAALVTASINDSRSKARDASRISQLREVSTALELYYLDNDSYPDTLDGTVIPDYLRSWPIDPLFGDGLDPDFINCDTNAADSYFCYNNTSSGQGYTLTASIESTGTKCRVSENDTTTWTQVTTNCSEI